MLGATMVEVVMIDTAALRASVPVYAVPCAALQTWPLHSAAPSSGCDGRHLHEELSGVLTFRGQRKTGELLRLRAMGHLADSQRQNRPPSPRLRRRVSKKYATDATSIEQPLLRPESLIRPESSSPAKLSSRNKHRLHTTRPSKRVRGKWQATRDSPRRWCGPLRVGRTSRAKMR